MRIVRLYKVRGKNEANGKKEANEKGKKEANGKEKK